MNGFICNYFQFRNALKLAHWGTDSYAAHKAFDSIGAEFDGLVDKYVESFLGRYGEKDFQVNGSTTVKFNLIYLGKYIDFLEGCKNVESPELSNIIDEMVAVLNKLKYLLTLK